MLKHNARVYNIDPEKSLTPVEADFIEMLHQSRQNLLFFPASTPSAMSSQKLSMDEKRLEIIAIAIIIVTID